MRKPRLLKGLVIRDVSSVDRAANPGAQVMFWKRDQTTTKEAAMSDDPQLIRRCIQEYAIDEDESLKLFSKLSKPDAYTALEKLSRMHSGGAGSPHLAFQKFVEGDGEKFYRAYRAMPEPSVAEKMAKIAKAAAGDAVTIKKGQAS